MSIELQSKRSPSTTAQAVWTNQTEDYQSLSDAELMALVAAGDAEALAAIYDRYARATYALALKIMHQPMRAEEVVQEVFVKLWRKPDRYDPQRGAFIKWILGVTHNQAIDQIMQERKHQLATYSRPYHSADTGMQPDADIPDQSSDLLEQVWRGLQRTLVRGLLSRLPLPQRRVIELAYFSGLSQLQIAEQLGEPLGTVKTRTRLAFKKLKAMFLEAELR